MIRFSSFFRLRPSQSALIVILLLPIFLLAQSDRILGPLDTAKMVRLSGDVSPKAQPQFDRGPVDPALQLNLVTMTFRHTPEQESALQQLILDQQNPSSPNYRRWLTPEEYADRFGLSVQDIAKVRAWLESQGLTVGYIARSKNWLTLNGTARQMTTAFRTQIHRYAVDGEIHYANASEPAIPAALQPVVLAITGLDDFRLHSSAAKTLRPRITAPGGIHFLAPDDIATIYDISRLYQAGIDGSGMSIVVAGQSDVDLSDIASFRSDFSLSANVPTVTLVPSSTDPGKTGDQDEADLDIEWTGAVARNAQIQYVNSTNAVVSAGYAISENLAPVVSFSFSGCENTETIAARQALRQLADQSTAQGVTWVISSGDSGAAACDAPFKTAQATQGLAVSFPASLPQVTAVGGAAFSEGTGTYWSAYNSSTLESALAYIPETAWNESNSNGLAASGGGVSVAYPQPSWQAGPGLPAFAGRAVPDIALSAATHDPYAIVSKGQDVAVGGTSAAAPVFAGMVALLDQQEGSQGLGNININLYRLAQTNIFHDIITGNNIVPCGSGTPNCTNASFGYSAGPGYDLVTGLGSVDAYNLVMGWTASTPASNVVPGCTPNPVIEQPADAQGNQWFYTVSVQETAGVATNLSGFTINARDFSSQIQTLFGTSTIPANGVISANLAASDLAVPTNVVFSFTGMDAGGRQWSQQLTVPFEAMQAADPPPTMGAVVNAGSYLKGLAAGSLATLFGAHLSPVAGIESPGGATSYRGVSITVGGRLAPLFAVANVNGREQINFQAPAGSLSSSQSVPIQINNNGAVASINVTMAPTQPGIFEYMPAGRSSYGIVVKLDGSVVGPANPAARGSTVVMYATGLGPTSPAVLTGQPGPVPPAYTNYPALVSINGENVTALFSGLAPYFIGLNQVNFAIPMDAAVGSADSLVVSVNGVASQTSKIAIQ